MKKILFVITKSNWGGAQRYVFDLATHLPQDQFDVSVALGGDGPLAQKLQAAGGMIYHTSSLQRDISFGKDFNSFLELYRLFKREQPDVVHLNSSKAGALGALAARLAGVPRIVFTAHGWPFAERRSLLWRTMAYLGSWATALLCHMVICVSKADLARGLRLPLCAHKMRLVYNGIDLHTQFGTGESIRSAFPAGVSITGTIGELTANKNQVALIERARKDSNLYVAIVGEGELRGYLESKIKEYGLSERVKLFGFVLASEALKGFDRFALPSLKEGLPYVLLEAKLAGLPIEARPVGGIPEILEQPIENFSLERMIAQTSELY